LLSSNLEARLGFFLAANRFGASSGHRSGKTILNLSLCAISGALAVALILAPTAQAQQSHKSAHPRPHAKSASAKSAMRSQNHRKPSRGASRARSEARPPSRRRRLTRRRFCGSPRFSALSYLDELCGSSDSGEWRARMQALLEAEAKTGSGKSGWPEPSTEAFALRKVYRVCTPNAQAVITRFLSEVDGSRMSRQSLQRLVRKTARAAASSLRTPQTGRRMGRRMERRRNSVAPPAVSDQINDDPECRHALARDIALDPGEAGVGIGIGSRAR